MLKFARCRNMLKKQVFKLWRFFFCCCCWCWWLVARLLACLPACLLPCLPACLLACLLACCLSSGEYVQRQYLINLNNSTAHSHTVAGCFSLIPCMRKLGYLVEAWRDVKYCDNNMDVSKLVVPQDHFVESFRQIQLPSCHYYLVFSESNLLLFGVPLLLARYHIDVYIYILMCVEGA